MHPPKQKPRLASWLSYPIGYEALHRALVDVPMFDELRLQFWSQTYRETIPFRKLIESGEPHCVLKAAFQRPTKVSDPLWVICVYPVARTHKATAKAVLVADGLPRVKQWLSTPRPPTWYWGEKNCDLIFDPIEGRITAHDRVEAI